VGLGMVWYGMVWYSLVGIDTPSFSWCTPIGIVRGSVVAGGESSSYFGGMQAGVYLGWVCSMCGSLIVILQ
jgi:hypothetical protein